MGGTIWAPGKNRLKSLPPKRCDSFFLFNRLKNLDLRLFDAWKKFQKKESPMVVNDGDESHGTLVKKTTNKNKSKLLILLDLLESKLVGG